MSPNMEVEIRDLVHEILGDGYASERVVGLTKKLLAMAWDDGAVHGQFTENPYSKKDVK